MVAEGMTIPSLLLTMFEKNWGLVLYPGMQPKIGEGSAGVLDTETPPVTRRLLA